MDVNLQDHRPCIIAEVIPVTQNCLPLDVAKLGSLYATCTSVEIFAAWRLGQDHILGTYLLITGLDVLR